MNGIENLKLRKTFGQKFFKQFFYKKIYNLTGKLLYFLETRKSSELRQTSLQSVRSWPFKNPHSILDNKKTIIN